MTTYEYIFLGIGVGLLLFIIFTYNKCVNYNNYVKEAFSTMDVYLKKRWDLIPNLIEIVKAFASHESDLFEHITRLRTNNYESLTNKQKLKINSQITEVLPSILVTCENYPQLKSNQHFVKLITELSQIEDEIAQARKYYNGTVREYNTLIETFPYNMIAKIFKFYEKEMFSIANEERKDPKVDL